MNKTKLIISAFIIAVISAAIFILLPEKANFEGLALRVGSTHDIAEGAFAQGAQKFSEEYGCTVEFTNDIENCDLIYSSGEDFSACQPIGKYINPNNRLYTRRIIEQSCTSDGEIYGITNVLLGNINYCIYNPQQFDGITTPYEYYKKGSWTWDNFINMGKELNSNISVDWNNSYINMMYALKTSKKGNTEFDYGSQQQIEWLNFVRTLIYDEGIINNTEGALKVGFLPQLTLDAISEDTSLRYIPWPTKDGSRGTVFVDEYHFCVPKNSQNTKAAVTLANYMIESGIEVRTNLYKSHMSKEDYTIFKKQLKKIYTFPHHTEEQYVPAQKFIDDFIHGKTVTEHIFNVENDALHIR